MKKKETVIVCDYCGNNLKYNIEDDNGKILVKPCGKCEYASYSLGYIDGRDAGFNESFGKDQDI